MNNPRVIHMLLLAGLLLPAPRQVPAQPMPDGNGVAPLSEPDDELPPIHSLLPPYLQGLELTATQRSHIAEILQSQTEAMRVATDAVIDEHELMSQLAFSPDYTEEKAKSMAEASSPILVELGLIRARVDHAIYQELTAEQQQQLKDNAMKFNGRLARR